jgi:hypothetical protein
VPPVRTCVGKGSMMEVVLRTGGREQEICNNMWISECVAQVRVANLQGGGLASVQGGAGARKLSRDLQGEWCGKHGAVVRRRCAAFDARRQDMRNAGDVRRLPPIVDCLCVCCDCVYWCGPAGPEGSHH